MKWKFALWAGVALSVAFAGDALATTSSKSAGHMSETCKAKLAAKGIKSKDRKTEWTKCMGDPEGYQ